MDKYSCSTNCRQFVFFRSRRIKKCIPLSSAGRKDYGHLNFLVVFLNFPKIVLPVLSDQIGTKFSDLFAFVRLKYMDIDLTGFVRSFGFIKLTYPVVSVQPGMTP